MNKKIVMCAAAVCLLIPAAGCGSNPAAVINLHTAKTASLQNWTEGSAAAKSITDYVKSVCTEGSESYVAPADRIAVFDVDGTLCGERFPTYFDNCLMFQRILHDNSCKVSAEDKAYTEAYEKSMLYGLPKPETDKSSGQILAEAFKGFTVEEYQAYIRDFMETPAWGFEGMNYGEAYFQPMVSLVKYLREHDYAVYIVSATYRDAVRVMTEGVLDEYIPYDRVIGTDLKYVASGDAARDEQRLSLGRARDGIGTVAQALDFDFVCCRTGFHAAPQGFTVSSASCSLMNIVSTFSPKVKRWSILSAIW